MAIQINLQAHINTKKLMNQFEALKNDDVMYQIHELFYLRCSPYVPMDTGMLNRPANVIVTKDSVKWNQRYARYQYMGELYLAANGSSWAKKDEKKFPSGKPLHYNTEKHELASKEWDKAMMRDKGDLFIREVKDILMERFKKLYG